ncbi:unnamed protein product [Pararhodospirillum photometricum DSM 122]|uniref:Uncharacterized protein n=1 Tax=Pararhodospirillum photometricum DSM 122 TaxID=1150469 RepID=H6SNB0_PARPM|nr:unnamed protein product [Pararhodospirillum photometricum DSM 122]
MLLVLATLLPFSVGDQVLEPGPLRGARTQPAFSAFGVGQGLARVIAC